MFWRATIASVMTTPDAHTRQLNPPTSTASLHRAVLGTAAMIVVLDQLAKLVIDTIIGPGRARNAWWLIDDMLGFDYVRNRGVAFGLNIGDSTTTLIVSSFAFVLIGAFFWRLAEKNQFASIGLGLLAGGAIGNLIDRARFDAVIDFVAVGPWPRFNVADSAITIGVLMLAWSASAGHAEPHNPDNEEQQHYGGKHPIPE